MTIRLPLRTAIGRYPYLLDKYLLTEFIGPFIICVFGFTVILLSGMLFELTDFIFIKNIPVATVSQMLLYKIPEMMVLTLPIAALFSTLLALGRLMQDSEIVIMRGIGLPIYRLVIPFFVAGLLTSGLAFIAHEHIVPWANSNFENMVRRVFFQDGYPLVEENVFFAGGDNRYFYIRKINTEDNSLQDVMVYEVKRNGFPTIITANSGSYEGNNWRFHDGLVQELDADGFVIYETRFQQMEILTEDPADVFIGNQRTTAEMNRAELRTHIERFQRSGLKVTGLVVDYHIKLSLPMASFIFVLFGAPLTLKTKGGRSFGVAVCLIVTFLYYIFTSVSRSLGINATWEWFSPLMAAWATNVLFAGSGVVLLFLADN